MRYFNTMPKNRNLRDDSDIWLHSYRILITSNSQSSNPPISHIPPVHLPCSQFQHEPHQQKYITHQRSPLFQMHHRLWIFVPRSEGPMFQNPLSAYMVHFSMYIFPPCLPPDFAGFSSSFVSSRLSRFKGSVGSPHPPLHVLSV